VAAVGLAECLGVFGQQPDQEIDPAEVTAGEALQPCPYLRLDLDLVQARHAPDAICI
jgi:hypothetical protein